MTLNLRQLRAFVAVFEEGSFNKAARRENATQSGLSTLVGNLEAQIGLRVFERTTKGVVPTQAGERLYRRSAAILRDLGDAESELQILAGDVAGRIRIGLIPAITYSFLAPALAEFSDRYPAVDVTIIEAYSPALTEGVARKEFDLAVVPVDRVNSRSRSTFFGRDSELLVSGQSSTLRHLKPVQLSALPPLRLDPANPRQCAARTPRGLFHREWRADRQDRRNGCDARHARAGRAERLHDHRPDDFHARSPAGWRAQAASRSSRRESRSTMRSSSHGDRRCRCLRGFSWKRFESISTLRCSQRSQKSPVDRGEGSDFCGKPRLFRPPSRRPI